MVKYLPVFLHSGLFLSLLIGPLWASAQSQSLEAVIESQSFDDLLAHDRFLEDTTDMDTAARALWEKYRKAVTSDAGRITEQETTKITYGDKTMKFSLSKKGAMPENGYPLYIALHGGGTAPAHVNDSQWEHMKIYYLDSVDAGIYVATRGVTDTWNLHFVDESYTLYDHLIENLVAFENVDPNRVYIMGFSAGGDGVYQITPRMADRWAAANMSAGHHNWITFDNLYNTPFLIQMGQYDSAYKRNTVAVENHVELNRLQAEREGYVHELFLHEGGSHNSWRDNDAGRRQQKIVANPENWLKGEAATSTSRNTNAIDWLNQYQRNSYPQKIYWDPKTAAARVANLGARYLTDETLKSQLSEPRELFYWLDVAPQQGDVNPGLVEASYDQTTNSIRLAPSESMVGLRVLLHPSMVDFSRPVTLTIGSELMDRVQVRPNLRTMTRTLLERGDAHYMFQAEIQLQKLADGRWTVITPAAR
ncbi:MAG TPA: prolyl oligopeptidase family serine peptidase [Oligoflexus sp.]|uniref:prolyl oligopeptidase family serine peptidase n=1 Tax=Oligoflexus sp. TaxID=1971216 RepID=UPI002D517FA1|nr:prolyl oligopeptidase family serine peptidase [Oligoflexus sp.]HYX37551.1 prolyl oligopeptidase family serine peptidase [Oligoflexus sp.]